VIIHIKLKRNGKSEGIARRNEEKSLLLQAMEKNCPLANETATISDLLFPQ
jgi:hypothetical protein